ncbi:MAG: response regulator [Pseudomonadales bacterium]
MAELLPGSVVYLVDDDEAVRHGLGMLLETVGHEVRAFGSADDFLANYEADRPACLILDIRMPSVSGLELQEVLAERGLHPPIIFLTGYGNVPAAVKALKGGAIDFFQKPVDDEQLLLDRVQEALQLDVASRGEASKRAEARTLLDQLTPRETQVMELMCQGKANKVIAAELEISERTVELHRAHLMKKLGIRSIPDLIRLKEQQDAGL